MKTNNNNNNQAWDVQIEDAVLRLSLDNLRSFPWIRDAERHGRLVLSVWRFNLATGELSIL